MIRFFVAGQPVTQGSKNAYVNRSTGRAHVVDHNPRGLAAWRGAIRSEAQRWTEHNDWDGPLEGPIAVQADFGLIKPKSYPKIRRTWPTKKYSGDVDKLARAILDAVTGILIVDDSQVITLIVHKDWARQPGVTIEIAVVGC